MAARPLRWSVTHVDRPEARPLTAIPPSVAGRRSTVRGAGTGRSAADGPERCAIPPLLPSVATALDSRCSVCNRSDAESSGARALPAQLRCRRSCNGWSMPASNTCGNSRPFAPSLTHPGTADLRVAELSESGALVNRYRYDLASPPMGRRVHSSRFTFSLVTSYGMAWTRCAHCSGRSPANPVRCLLSRFRASGPTQRPDVGAATGCPGRATALGGRTSIWTMRPKLPLSGVTPGSLAVSRLGFALGGGLGRVRAPPRQYHSALIHRRISGDRFPEW